MASPAENEKVVREAHAKSMEALAADVHPYSASAIRDWEKQLDAALAALRAQAEAGEDHTAAIEAAEASVAKHERHIDTLLARAEAAEARLADAHEALRFYANENNWTQMTSWGGRIHDDESAAIADGGSIARAALSGEPS